MPVQLLHRIIRFLGGLEPVQRELESVYERRRAALVSGQPTELQTLVTEEEQLSRRLRDHLRQRDSILAAAKQQGLPGDNLRVLVLSLQRFVSDGTQNAAEAELDADQYRQTVAWLQRVERRSWKLRRDSWANWHAVRRSCREFTAMRELVANCGERRDSHGLEQRAAIGGALIDAKV